MKNIALVGVFLGLGLLFTNFTHNKTAKKSSVFVAKVGVNIGDMAPDLQLESPSGKKYKLSSLRGKYVLIDFWASWCGPCRKENPNLVNAYSKYKTATFKKGKGFEIFSVSLDNDDVKWKSAIKKDNLTWKYHVSELSGWYSEFVKTYKIKAIPQSYLVDPKGKIVAKNLKGMKLHTTLDRYVKKF